LPYYENDILYTLNEERFPLIVTHKHTARVLMKYLLKIKDEEFEDYELPEKKIIMVYLKDDLTYDTHKEIDFYNTDKKIEKGKN
jgi:bisphosphoglycerate-dependent phosphoglycerate mutase